MLFEITTQKVKVKMSLGPKAVISSLSKLNIELKNFFYKSCSVWYAIIECGIQSESKAVILSHSSNFTLSKLSIKSIKILLRNLFSCVCQLSILHKKENLAVI